MELNKKEFDILWAVNEGLNDIDSLRVFSGFDEDIIKSILEKLSDLELIDLIKKINKYYNEEFLNAYIKTDIGGVLDKYKDWIPNKEDSKPFYSGFY